MLTKKLSLNLKNSKSQIKILKKFNQTLNKKMKFFINNFELKTCLMLVNHHNHTLFFNKIFKNMHFKSILWKIK